MRIVDKIVDNTPAIVVYISGEERITYPYESASERIDQLSNAVNSLLGEMHL